MTPAGNLTVTSSRIAAPFLLLLLLLSLSGRPAAVHFVLDLAGGGELFSLPAVAGAWAREDELEEDGEGSGAAPHGPLLPPPPAPARTPLLPRRLRPPAVPRAIASPACARPQPPPPPVLKPPLSSSTCLHPPPNRCCA
ncbi:Os08g0266250 [Oryza sativa Japonica Group]|uniref:Os08g0266250 protein n=1 Tax=Oryza sativa subsp. japonica TaxID=39947 RepID=A0A0P0XE94_ORYSJ|nr:Os08g0266250 [Oryza sativa Japonica Group]